MSKKKNDPMKQYGHMLRQISQALGGMAAPAEPKYPYVKGHPTLVVDEVKPVAYHLYVSLTGSPVKIFRRLTVPSNLRLEHLANIIIQAMGWDGDHLHQFYVDGIFYAPEDDADIDMPQFYTLVDSMTVTIGDLLHEKGKSIKMEYDLGDRWMHQVRLSSIDEKGPVDTITLDSGSGGCPEEDIGGIHYYAEMLDGGEIEPRTFSLATARKRVSAYVAQVRANEQDVEAKPKKTAKTKKRAKIVRMIPYNFTTNVIRSLHPKTLASSPTDSDYAQIANKLERSLMELPFFDEIGTADAMKAIISRVIMYYEDIVADAGMWRGFVAKNMQLYGRPYPFYPVEEEPYVDEPDLNAVRLLVWDAFHELRGEGKIINPENPALTDLAEKLYEVLEEEFEETPINEALADYFRKATFVDDFYELRDVLKWIFFDCYLTSDHRALDLVEDKSDDLDDIFPGDQAFYVSECVTSMTTQVGMLALLPKDWLALFVGEVGDKQLAKKIADIKITEFVTATRLIAYDKKTVSLEDVDGNHIVVDRGPDYAITDDELKQGDGAIGCYVEFDGKWYLNGNQAWGMISQVFDQFMQEKKDKIMGVTDEQYAALMEKTGGSPLVYFKTSAQLKKFLVQELGMKITVHTGMQLLDGAKDIVVFVMGPNKGMAMVQDVAKCICDPRNPCYKPKECADLSLALIFNGINVPAAMVRYLVSHKMLPDAGINSIKGEEYGRKLAQDNLDFFCRAYRREDY